MLYQAVLSLLGNYTRSAVIRQLYKFAGINRYSVRYIMCSFAAFVVQSIQMCSIYEHLLRGFSLQPSYLHFIQSVSYVLPAILSANIRLSLIDSFVHSTNHLQ